MIPDEEEEEHTPEVQQQPVPIMPTFIAKRFANEVDQMMYEFQMKKNTGLRFEKVGENSYIIGTRKVQAKVNNGILLLRVGGGFMDIDNFIK